MVTHRSFRISVLVPASPTDGFYGQLAMQRRAFDALGGKYRDARLIATVGAPAGTRVPDRWARHLRRIDVRFVPEDEPGRYRTQAYGRWNGVPPDTELVLLADADTLAIRPFDDLIASVVDSGAVAGTIAHASPQFRSERDPEQGWQAIARRLIGQSIPTDHLASLPGPGQPAPAMPFYLNFGAVLMPMHVFRVLRVRFLDLVARVEPELVEPWYAGQVALALAMRASGAPTLPVDLRYNFPNDPLAEARYPDQLADIRTIHYLRTERFDRQQIFASEAAFGEFLDLPLEGANAQLQQRVREITDGRYPFRAPARGIG